MVIVYSIGNNTNIHVLVLQHIGDLTCILSNMFDFDDSLIKELCLRRDHDYFISYNVEKTQANAYWKAMR